MRGLNQKYSDVCALKKGIDTKFKKVFHFLIREYCAVHESRMGE